MTTTAEPTARNGVDVPNLFATIDHVRSQPDLAEFRFRDQPLGGRHAQSHHDRNVQWGRR